MAILNIVKYPNPILRGKSKEIKEITPELKRLALNMQETMIANKGLGLAAPQVGESKRIIVVQTENSQKALINPKIFRKSREMETGEEGCLCAPGLFLKIKRASVVEISALDIDGREVKIKAEGLPARILQHEIDHLNGILFFDRIPFWQRLKYFLNFRKRKFLR